MFITKYEISEVYTPAEGGFFLNDRHLVESHEVVNVEKIQDKLFGFFFQEVKDGNYTLPFKATETKNGHIYEINDHYNYVRLFISDKDTTPYEGNTPKIKTTWMEVGYYTRYNKEKVQYEYFVETEEGENERPAEYC